MSFSFPILPGGHLLAIEGLEPPHIGALLELAESYALLNRSGKTQRDLLKGRTLINLFFEDSTRTRTSFELAAFRLSADVINISASSSSLTKGETLKDTALNLQALQADIIVLRHSSAGAAQFLDDCLLGLLVGHRDEVGRALAADLKLLDLVEVPPKARRRRSRCGRSPKKSGRSAKWSPARRRGVRSPP